MIDIDLDRFFGEHAIAKGEQYYRDDRVVDIYRDRSGAWIGEVMGRSSYRVMISLMGSELRKRYCDCPVGGEGGCKHVVAVLLRVMEEEGNGEDGEDGEDGENGEDGEKVRRGEEGEGVRRGEGVRKGKVAGSLEEVLRDRPHDELVDFILDAMDKEASFRDRVRMRFVLPGENPVGKYKKMVTAIYSRAKGRGGFVHYSDAPALVRPLMDLLEEAEGFLKAGLYTEGVAIAQAVLQRLPDFANNMDDSDGGITDLNYYSSELLMQAGADGPDEIKKALFAWAKKEQKKTRYDDFGLGGVFWDLMCLVAPEIDQVDGVLQMIEAELISLKDREFGQYGMTGLIVRKIELLDRAGREGEVLPLFEAYKGTAEVRRLWVEHCMARKDYDGARALLHEALGASSDQGTSWSGNPWKEMLLDIARQLGEQAEIRRWAHELLFDRAGNMDYYRVIKDSYEQAVWPAEMEKLLDAMAHPADGQASRYVYLLMEIFAEEGLVDRLLALLQANNGSQTYLDRYTDLLKEQYPGELLQLYRPHLIRMGRELGRKNYRRLAKVLKSLLKIEGGDILVAELVAKFRAVYGNRPAMMEELEQVVRLKA